MQFNLFNIKIKISFTFFVLVLLLIIFNKTEYLYISIISAILHEFAHLFTLKFFGAKILEFKISLFGGNIKTEDFITTNYFQDVLVYFSGPLINLFFTIFCYFLSFFFHTQKLVDFTWVNLALALFNLLPFYSFDGGKILSAILKIKFTEKQSELILTISSFIILIPFIYFSITLFLHNKKDFYYLIVTLLMLLTIIFKK